MLLLSTLVTRVALRDPDRVAVVDGERALSYRELETSANQVSRLLRSLGVARGDRVGLYLDKSIEAVVGLYGIMKAGAAYVPLDTNAPAPRLATIGADCGITVLITGTEVATSWQHLIDEGFPVRALAVLNANRKDTTLSSVPEGVEVVTGDEASTLDGSAPAETRTIDRDLAYILYTSGSTGQPKGVMVSHANCLGFVGWAADEFGLGPNDRFSQFAPLLFDLSTFDLFACSLVGGSLHLVPKSAAMFPGRVKTFLRDEAITVAYAVPSLLAGLVERAELEHGTLPQLRTVLFAGEVFPPAQLSALMKALPSTRFANLYGPTETNVCTFHEVNSPPTPDGPPVSIGRAIVGDEGYVVGDDGNLVEPGCQGELYIRGVTVMQGYWGDQDRTSASLIPNPFQPQLGDPVYKTGDLVIEEADGTYTLVGRRDHQIKRRGYRIELGDIESSLLANDAVLECAVTAPATNGVTDWVVAHVVASNVGRDELIRFCAARLPRYMLPDEIIFLDALPRTVTGKIDRYALATQPTSNE